MKVSIIMGSLSDSPIADKVVSKLIEFGIDYEVKVISAHRALRSLEEYVEKSENEILFIGTEGGFAQHERAKIKSKFGLNSPNILRSNTAIISVCAKKLL